MRIDRIDQELARCEEHCSSEPVDVEVENLLTGSILILICSEFERKVKGLILDRCSSVSDESIRKYIEESIRHVLQGIKIGDLSGLLGKFGPLHKKEFRRRLDENNMVKTMYDSILTNRNRVAHGEGSNATMREVKRYYEKAHVVLDFFRDALRGEGDGAPDDPGRGTRSQGR